MARRVRGVSAPGVLLLAAALTACGGDGAGDGLFVVEPGELDFGDVEPASTSRTLTVQVINQGSGPARIRSGGVTTTDATCGSFALDGELPRRDIPGGGTVDLAIRFDRDPEVPAGCACWALGSLDLSFDADPGHLQVPLVVQGACDQALRCFPEQVAFPAAIMEYTYEEQVSCQSLAAAPLVVDGIDVSGDSDGIFSVADIAPGLPANLTRGTAVTFTVRYQPPDEGAVQDAVVVRLASGETVTLPLSGEAGRERPLCVDGIPPDPEPELDTADYSIVLETDVVSAYTGVVRSRWYYDDQPPMIADVLVTSGPKADPACEVGQSGHMAHWEGQDCLPRDEGLFINVHAIPHSATVDEWVRSLTAWDGEGVAPEVTVRGYEVERVNYATGGYWTDAGCHTLIITWICDH